MSSSRKKWIGAATAVALVVVGGMLFAPLLILLVLPVLILKFSRAQELPQELPRESGA